MARQVHLIERGASADQSRPISLTKNEFLIGRGADCDLRLPVTSVSRHHCLIRHDSGGEVHVIDLGSSNGTFVNGQRVRSQAAVQSGDELLVGTTCRFLIDFGDQKLGIPDADPLAITQRVRKDDG